MTGVEEMELPKPTRARRLLRRKRAVVRDSLVVVRTTWRTLRHDRFLMRVLIGIVVGSLALLIAWKVASKASVPGDRLRLRPIVIAIRLMIVLCVQYVVAAWLYSRWTGELHERGRHLWHRLVRRLPAFFFWAVVLGWLDRATQSSSFSTLIRTGASFGLSYALSYAVPAAAVYRSGMFHAFRRSYQVFRKTFGADMFAWSGVWLVTGFVALVTAIPEAFRPVLARAERAWPDRSHRELGASAAAFARRACSQRRVLHRYLLCPHAQPCAS